MYLFNNLKFIRSFKYNRNLVRYLYIFLVRKFIIFCNIMIGGDYICVLILNIFFRIKINYGYIIFVMFIEKIFKILC